MLGQKPSAEYAPASPGAALARLEARGVGGVRRRFRELSVLVHPDRCSLPGAQKASCQDDSHALFHPPYNTKHLDLQLRAAGQRTDGP